jgi:site-specific DNA-methyltransferase (adenine-specific)
VDTNTLYYGDNLPVLREHFPDESVDLIYLDPPFNSNRSYNVLFKEASKASSPAQIEAFEDTWHWGPHAEEAFMEVTRGSDDTARLLKAMVDALGRHNDVTAYLCMMAVRLIELRRVLKPTGSIYLHCDPTAGAYLKVLMDSIFGPQFFRNEISWRRTRAHNDAKITRYGSNHDTLLFYSKGPSWTFNKITVGRAALAPQTHDIYRHTDGKLYRKGDCRAPGNRGPRYEWNGHIQNWRFTQEESRRLQAEGRIVYSKTGMPRVLRPVDLTKGSQLQDFWADIDSPNSGAGELLGYPTQKPLALLERIITASSNVGDVVLDPFCGCGTAVHAAQKLDRRWAGIDITYLAIGLIRRRMEDAFPGLAINEVGVPFDLPGAAALAAHDPYQFQFWAIDKLGAQPVGGEHRRGADRGIDGVIPFVEGATNLKRVIVSVKAGHIEPAYVQQLKGVMEGQGAPMGVLVTLKEPTRAMRTEAVSAGSYHSDFWNRDYPRIQLITAADLLAGKRVDMPQQQPSPFAQAPRESERGEQTTLI